MNWIYFGDNLSILQTFADESIDLIYIDPPFNTGKKQVRTQIRTKKSENGDRKGFKGQSYETVEIGTKEYEDNYGDGFILEFLKPRLIQAHRLLAKHGSIYLHIDYREVHYCKLLLDDIFGRNCFLNEIIWAYDYGAKAKTRWPSKHDNILLYVKDPNYYIFNIQAVDREPYMAPGLVGPEKAEKGKLPTDTWWHTIVGTNSAERTGYPTQKPLGVINRIVQASSLPGQTVLDFFAGSGTIGESCHKLGRNFILIDNNPVALEVMARRFQKYKDITWVNFDPAKVDFSKKYHIAENGKDSEFDLLASMAILIRTNLEKQNEVWKNSPFSWVTELPAAKKGKLGRDLIYSWCRAMGVNVHYQKDPKAGLVINGYKIAIKFSTLWSKGGYKFQQIKKEGYDYLICLGISPTKAHCWVFSREFVIKQATPQHSKGSPGAELWLTINPEKPQEWAVKYGGTMENAYKLIKKLEKNQRSKI